MNIFKLFAIFGIFFITHCDAITKQNKFYVSDSDIIHLYVENHYHYIESIIFDKSAANVLVDGSDIFILPMTKTPFTIFLFIAKIGCVDILFCPINGIENKLIKLNFQKKE